MERREGMEEGRREREDREGGVYNLLYLSCVVQQEASSAISVLSVARRETPLTNQRSLLVTQALHTTRKSHSHY